MKKGFKTIGFKLSVLYVLFSVALCVAICLFSYYASWNEYTDFYSAKAREAAALAATMVDGDAIAGYLQSGETDQYYHDLAKRLGDLKREQNILYLYLFVPEQEYFTYILDVEIETDDPANISALGDVYQYKQTEYDNLVPDVEAKRASSKKVIAYNTDYGPGVMAWAPVFDSRGALAAMVEADLSLDLVVNMLNHYMTNIILISSAIILVVVALLLFITRRMVSRPLARLTKKVLGFASGDALGDFAGDIETGDEMQVLSEAFGSMARDIDHYTKNMASVAADKERIETELSLGADIQLSLLPRVFPAFPHRREFDLGARIRPAKVTGGDFYSFFLVDDSHLCLMTANVAGQGIPAALFMVVTKTIMENQLMTGQQVDQAMAVINARLFASGSGEVTVAAFVGILNTDTGVLTYVSAGQGGVMLLPNGGECQWLKVQDTSPLAEGEHVAYRQRELKLRQGDKLFLCTDGAFLVEDGQGAALGREGIRGLVAAAGNKALEALLDQVMGKLEEHMHLGGQRDDVTLLVLAYEKGDKYQAELTVPARAERFGQVQAFLKRQLTQNGLGGAFYAQLIVALEELFVLVISRGGGPVTVRCRVEEQPKVAELEILYGGGAQNPLEALEGPDADAVDFVKRHMDRVEYRVQEGKNVVIIAKAEG